MRKGLLLGLFLLMASSLKAQFVVSTVPPLTGGTSTTGGITFNLRANSSAFIDTVYCRFTVAVNTTTDFRLWYSATDTTGPVTVAAPNWTMLQDPISVTVGTPNLLGVPQIVAIPITGGLLINAGSTYRFYIGVLSGTVSYNSITSGVVDFYTDGNLTIATGNLISYAGPFPTPTIHPRAFNGGVAYRFATGLDARPSALITPQTLTIGANPVTVRVQNAAATPITSATIGYQVNNDPAVITATHTFNTALTPGQTEDYSFPTPINIPAATSINLKVWTTNANGNGPDVNTSNDTLYRSLCTGISGTFSIGGPTANYPTIAAAVQVLNQCGVTGPVTFNINPGTYYGSYVLGSIPGANSANQITFASATGSAADVILIHDTAATVPTRSHFVIGGISRVSLQFLTFRRITVPSAAGQSAVLFTANAESGQVVSCVFEDQTLSTSTFNNGLTYQSSLALILNNQFTGFYYPVYLEGQTSAPWKQLNTVQNNTFLNYTYRCIYALNQDFVNIDNNRIENFQGISTVGAGIWLSNVYASTVSNNRILGGLSGYGIITNNLNGDTLSPTSNTNKVYNNVISGQQASSLSTTTALVIYPMSFGASFSATAIPANPRDAVEIINNTIIYNVNTTSTSTLQAGVYFLGGTTALPGFSYLHFRNNHIEVNPIVGSLPSAFRLIRFANTAIIDSLVSGNNNYIMTGATLPPYFRENGGSTDYTLVSDWRTLTGRDTLSGSLNPAFISNALPIPTSIGFDNRGAPVGFVTTDVTGASRSTTTPDIGAYEFTGSIFSQINFTPLADTLIGTQRLFTASISDSMSTLIAGSARLFYKKSSQSNWFVDSLPGIAGANHTFLINYSTLGGVSALDTIQYYVAVRNATNTVTTAPLGGNGLYLSNQVVPLTVLRYLILPVISGNYNVGVSGPADFPTITAAANFINNGLLSGSATFTLIDSAYGPNETFPILITGRPGSSATNTITIKPATNRSAVVVTGAPIGTNSMFILQNQRNFIFDGSNNGTTSRNLRLINNSVSTTSAVVHLRNQVGETATNITLRNLHITGNSNSQLATFGIHLGALTLSTAGLADGFSAVRIENNRVEKVGIGIYARGSTNTAIQGIQIRNNLVGSVDTANFIANKGIDLQNALQGVVEGNEVFNLLTTTSTTLAGIEIGGTASDSIRVNRNFVHDITSRYFTLPAAWGINVVSGNNAILSNNVIYGLLGGNYSNVSNFYSPIGIRLAGGIGNQILYNSINIFGSHNNTSTAGSASSPLVVTSTAVTGIVIRNNVFANSMTTTSTALSFWTAMWFPTSYAFAGTTINNNAYHVDTAANYTVARVGTATTSPTYRTVNDWRAWMAGQVGTNETASIPFATNSLAPFISNTNLNIPAGTTTGIESGAVVMPVLGTPNTDFNAVNRPASGNAAPDMGAYEFNGIALPDQFPPTIDSIKINPEGNQCLPVARTISVWARDNLGGRGIDSVIVSRQINGVAQPLILLSRSSGTAANGLWTGTIPAAANGAIVELTVRSRDSIGNSSPISRAISFQDDYLQLTVSNDTTILQGDTASLRANFLSGSPLLITEVDLGGTDAFEIQNVSGSSVNVAGWKVVVSNSYTDINSVNPIVQTLTGTMASGQTMTWSDASTATNYWGNNLLWNPGAFPTFSGWILILKPNNEVADAMFWGWPATNIQGAAITVGGSPVNVATAWAGSGLNATTVPAGITMSRIGNRDNNDSTGFALLASSLNATNPGLQLPLGGGNVTWTTLAGVVVDSVALIRVSPNTTTTYIATITDGFCTKSDTVVVTVNVPNLTPDVGVSSFITPNSTTILNGISPVPVTVVIKNYGPVAVFGFDVEYRVNGGASIVTNSITSTILPGDSLQHTFTVPWTPTQAGQIVMCANTTGVANEVNRSNDTSCINLTSIVSVAELAQNNRLIGKVYPNPAESFVNFEFNEFKGSGLLEIHDKLGRVVATLAIDRANGKMQTIQTDSWSAGMYSYRFIASDQVQHGNLIINR